jgi:hypothetical protein
MQQGDEVAIVTGACKGIGRLRQRRCIRPDSACSAPAGGPPASLRKRFQAYRQGCSYRSRRRLPENRPAFRSIEQLLGLPGRRFRRAAYGARLVPVSNLFR